MEMDYYSERNREAWNEAVSVHRKNRKIYYCEVFKNKNYSALDMTLLSLLKKIQLFGKTVAQLCCNNGHKLLSIVNTTGASGVGFDISDEFITEAKKIAKSAKFEYRFVRTDLYDLTAEHDHNFDLVLFAEGALI